MVTMPFFCRISSPTIFVQGVVRKNKKWHGEKKAAIFLRRFIIYMSSLTTRMFFYQKSAPGPSSPVGPSEEILPTPPWISITKHFSAQAEVPQLRSGLFPHDLEIFETVFRPLPRLGS